MSEALKVLKAAKIGDILFVTHSRDASRHRVRVHDRWARKGRDGYVSLTVEYVERPEGALDKRETFRVRSYLPVQFSNVERERKRAPRKPGIPRPSMSGSESVQVKALREQVAKLIAERDAALNQAHAARTSASMYERLYTAERLNRGTIGGAFRVSADAMQFLRFSGIEQFPCSAEELKKGRVAMIAKLHPDHTQKDSNAQFCSAMRGFDELSKLVR